jgi:predicted nucleic acid-binding protein
MIIDTDVLIWFFRGHAKAITELESIASGNRFVSIISYMELLQGVRNKSELKELKKLFEYSEFIILPLNHDIGIIACRYLEQFSLSSGLRLEDALVAATASVCAEAIFTGNYKHFKDMNISFKRFSPQES